MKRTEARKPKLLPPPPAATRASALVRYCTPLFLVLAAAALVLAGLLLAGRLARGRVAELDRYTILFRDIECIPAPPSLDRAAFLSEVQYLAAMPDQVRLLEDALVPRLTEAFLQHPWVERVERIHRSPQYVRVWLSYRIPVLAVRVEGQVRAVDAHGTLLPAETSVAGLPVFSGTAKPPAGPAGTRWGDPAVEAAAAQARKAAEQSTP